MTSGLKARIPDFNYTYEIFLAMFDLPSTRFQHLESEYCHLKQNDVILSGNRPLRAASGSVHRVLRLVPLLRDPNYSEPGRD